MRVLILSEGTRGDLEPCLALAAAADAAGHQSTVVGWNWSPPADLKAAAAAVNYVTVGERGIPESARAAAARVTHGGTVGWLARIELARRLRPLLTATLGEIWAVAAAGADIVVHQPGIMAGQHIAEKLRVPAAAITLTPAFIPTRDFANPLLSPSLPVPRILNRASYGLTRLLLAPHQKAIGDWRRQTLELEPRPGQRDPLRLPDGRLGPVLGAYSRFVVPGPPDTPELHITGYWRRAAEEDWQPPPALAEFLASGDPPVYFGFSSTHMDRSSQAWDTVRGAIQLAGVRAVVNTGWADTAVAPDGDRIHVIGGAPHLWLLPRVAAVVHHGGAGSTAAAILSAKPQVICPVSADQPFWAARMRRLGVAASVRPLRRHSAQSLGRAIRQAMNSRMAERAQDLSSLVRTERGVSNAIGALEEIHANYWGTAS
jgi:sterol 3beta-glucosyltransferase